MARAPPALCSYRCGVGVNKPNAAGEQLGMKNAPSPHSKRVEKRWGELLAGRCLSRRNFRERKDGFCLGAAGCASETALR